MQHARERDEVDVMPCRMGEGPGLPPPCNPAVDELRIIGKQHLRPQAEPLHHSGSVPLDQPIRGLAKVARSCYAFRAFQVERDSAACSAQNSVRSPQSIVLSGGPIDPDYL